MDLIARVLRPAERTLLLRAQHNMITIGMIVMLTYFPWTWYYIATVSSTFRYFEDILLYLPKRLRLLLREHNHATLPCTSSACIVCRFKCCLFHRNPPTISTSARPLSVTIRQRSSIATFRFLPGVPWGNERPLGAFHLRLDYACGGCALLRSTDPSSDCLVVDHCI